MRPALQRLLARPSSLDFLQYLLGPHPTQPPEASTNRDSRQCCPRRRLFYRSYASAATAVATDIRTERGYDKDMPTKQSRLSHQTTDRDGNGSASSLKEVIAADGVCSKSGIRKSRIGRRKDTRKQFARKSSHNRGVEEWSHLRLEFESALDQVSTRRRLVERSRYKRDLMLWSFLLDYRKRIYGSAGVLTIWNAFRAIQMGLSKRAPLVGRMRSIFLELGFENEAVLQQIVEYIDHRRRSHGFRDELLYVSIVQHFLTHGRSAKAFYWHEHLSKFHGPSEAAFGNMCRHVARLGGDLVSLEKLYREQESHCIYHSIVPALCERKDYRSALRWHFICLEHRDLPFTPEHVAPLLRFLITYDRNNARLVSRSLVDAKAPFIANKPEEQNILSREFMNTVHGETLNVPAKSYNDPLGARWFASSWVPLDVAINSVHALGMDEIGPLSLQAIALRDPDPISVSKRITQLKDLGISIGDSVFSRAVDKFSRDREHEILESLLRSDQHPDELEDWDLQDRLLLSYARTKDWVQFRRTFAIQGLRSSSKITRNNIMLRVHAEEGNSHAIFQKLSTMQPDRVIVKPKTISTIIRSILPIRRPSKRPTTASLNELKLAVHFLKSLMGSGCHVPVLSWREILRRLAMLGRLPELEGLSLFLAASYNNVSLESQGLDHNANRISAHLSIPHELHPLRILFSPQFQKAVVESGFIRALRNRASGAQTAIDYTLPDVTSGITLLKKLHDYGVHIDSAAVRAAILNRLIAYFGPGISNRKHNRQAREVLMRGQSHWRVPLSHLANQIDEALGQPSFTVTNLPHLIESIGRARLIRVRRRREHMAIRRPIRITRHKI